MAAKEFEFDDDSEPFESVLEDIFNEEEMGGGNLKEPEYKPLSASERERIEKLNIDYAKQLERIRELEEEIKRINQSEKDFLKKKWPEFMQQLSFIQSIDRQYDPSLFSCNGETFPLTKSNYERISSTTVQAFHATSLSHVMNILRNGFICGSRGTQGPGIYFCPRPIDCVKKVVEKSIKSNQRFDHYPDEPPIFLFEVDLSLGNYHYMNTHNEDMPISLEDFDSVIFDRVSGFEYIVYRPIQVTIRNLFCLDWNLLGAQSFSSLPDSKKQSRAESFALINRFLDTKYPQEQIVDRMLKQESVGASVRVGLADSNVITKTFTGKKGKKSKRVIKRTKRKYNTSNKIRKSK
jgi:hypothetical protein